MVLNQKISLIFQKISDFAAFSDLFTDLLNIRLLPPPPKKPIPHGSPIVVFYKKWRKNRISNADRQKPISDS